MPEVVASADHTKPIGESKFFRLCQKVPMLRILVPDLPTQMTGETEIDEVCPREEEDGDHTRILINYTNTNGKSSLYKLLDTEGLDRQYDIDHFINGFMNASLAASCDDDDPAEVADKVILLAMNMAVSGVLGVDNEMRNIPSAVVTCEQVVRSVTAVMFPEGLDVLIMVQETPRKEGAAETDSIISAMWAVKKRAQPTA